MKWLPFGGTDDDALRFGVVVDIGSGSVGAAVVSSDPSAEFPEVIWSHREYLPETRGLADAEKRLHGTILNVFLELGAGGLKALRAVHPGKLPDLVQVSVSAPFAYTISRSASFKSDKPVKITKSLIKELESKAAAESLKHAGMKYVSKDLKLALLSNSTVVLTLNGYPVNDPYDSLASAAMICQLVSLTPTTMQREVENACDKILPRADLDMDSFMSIFFRALSGLTAALGDACLVSVTAEATEISVVREGVPQTSNFTASGTHTLGRAIAKATGLPFTEALSMMKDNEVDSAKSLAEAKKQKLEAEIGAYEEELAKLFQETGDALSIPKKIFLHTDRLNERFFADRLKAAAERATGMKHSVHPVTSEFFSFGGSNDSRLLCSAYVFHKKLYLDDFLEK